MGGHPFNIIQRTIGVYMRKKVPLQLTETALNIRDLMSPYLMIRVNDGINCKLLQVIQNEILLDVKYLINLHRNINIRENIPRPYHRKELFYYYLDNANKFTDNEFYEILKHKIYHHLQQNDWEMWEVRKDGVDYSLVSLGDFRIENWKDLFYADGVYYPEGVPGRNDQSLKLNKNDSPLKVYLNQSEVVDEYDI